MASAEAAQARARLGATWSSNLPAVRVLARRALGDARVRTIAFAFLFAVNAYVQPVGYRHTYPTPADRASFAHSFAGNKGLRLFYGEPHGLHTVSGYAAWRVGGTLAIVAAAFGLLAAVRALRAEEDAGRTELVLSGPVAKSTVFASAMTAVVAQLGLLWLAELAGFLAGGLPAGGSAYLALATTSVAAVCVGVGAVASQLAPTRRLALELGGAVAALLFLARVIADTAGGTGWLRWATPLGWAEEMRPFTGARPLVLLAPAAATALLLLLAARIARRRDIGTGLLAAHDAAEPRLALLSSPTAHALRGERVALLTWAGGAALFAFVLGVVSKSVSSTSLPRGVRREIEAVGVGSVLTPTGYLALVFLFFVLVLSLFACAQLAAARHEEVEQRLATMLALPVSRSRWLGGRVALAAGAMTAIALLAGLLAWAGAASAGAGVSLGDMLAAGANCLPAALLFLGLAALAYGAAPRASSGLAYGLVTAAFLWQLVGSLLGAPHWLVEATPFRHVGLVPVQAFKAPAAAVMLALAAASGLAAAVAFRRRDLAGSL